MKFNFLIPSLLKLFMSLKKECPEVLHITIFPFFWKQYLELRFNKYVRLCGTIVYVIQTVSSSPLVYFTFCHL